MAKKNYNYGKIEDGKLVYAPNKIIKTVTIEQREIEMQVINATAEDYLSQGWKKIVKNPYPTDGKNYIQHIVEEDETITVEWIEDQPQPQEPTIEERVEASEEAIIELAEMIGEMKNG